MKRLGFFLAVASIACGASVEPSFDEGPGGTAGLAEPEIIGGVETPLSSYPSTVQIGRCSGVKVGPTLVLTAAHCLVDLSTMEPKFGPGKPIRLGATSRAVAAVHLHPAYAKVCADTMCSIPSVAQKADAPDVALLELAREIEAVPSASIDATSLTPGQTVMLVGYGCIDGVHVPETRVVVPLMTAPSTILEPSAAVHEGSALTAADAPVYSGNYLLTGGPAATGPGLCPGDSGGPVYGRRNGNLVVVGINANYTLRPDAADRVGVPVTNWHTRVDAASRNGVHAWIETFVR